MGMLIAALVAVAQADMERLVRELDDDRLEVRESASRALLEAGPRALPALRRAVADAGSAERRERAWALVLALDPEFAEREETRRQRPVKLRLVSLDVTNAPFEDVLDSIAAQTGMVPVAMPDPERRVRLSVRARPVREVIAALDAGGMPPDAIHAEGVSLTFKRRAWPDTGAPAGFVLRTNAQQDFEGDFEFDVTPVSAQGAVAFETCSRHSPAAIFVRDPALGEIHLVLKATRRWYRDVGLCFRDPKSCDELRINPFFKVEISERGLALVSRREVPASVLASMLDEGAIEVWPRVGVRLASVASLARSRRLLPGEKHGAPAWCGCLGKPSADPRPEVPPAPLRHVVALPFSNRLSDILSVSVNVRVPVEESFEAVSPPLK